MKKQVQIQYVIDKLTYFCHYIKINNKNSFTDINIMAEGFIMNLLNAVFQLNLQNLNNLQGNYHGVDLGDLSEKIAFQVTSKKDSKKIIETYEKVFKDYKGIGKVADVFSEHIYFFIIDEKKIAFRIRFPGSLKIFLSSGSQRVFYFIGKTAYGALLN